MLSFEEFKDSPKCKRLVLSEEDTPQDAQEGRRLVEEDQRRQYDSYLAQTEPATSQGTSEEQRVGERLTMLRNNHIPVAQHVSQQPKSRAAYFREYRKRPKKCPHCGNNV